MPRKYFRLDRICNIKWILERVLSSISASPTKDTIKNIEADVRLCLKIIKEENTRMG